MSLRRSHFACYLEASMLFAVSCGREPTVESRAQAVFAAYPSKGPGAYARAMYELIVARAPLDARAHGPCGLGRADPDAADPRNA